MWICCNNYICTLYFVYMYMFMCVCVRSHTSHKSHACVCASVLRFIKSGLSICEIKTHTPKTKNWSEEKNKRECMRERARTSICFGMRLTENEHEHVIPIILWDSFYFLLLSADCHFGGRHSILVWSFRKISDDK